MTTSNNGSRRGNEALTSLRPPLSPINPKAIDRLREPFLVHFWSTFRAFFGSTLDYQPLPQKTGPPHHARQASPPPRFPRLSASPRPSDGRGIKGEGINSQPATLN